jgi:nitronate monooxygenase
MGVAVSHWNLARVVAKWGQLGVVSGTALDTVLVRRLQDGDIGGHYRRALEHFPISAVADQILNKFFKSQGRRANEPYKLLSLPTIELSHFRQEILMAAAFSEVFLAKEGHQGSVGINFLEKIQIPTLPSLYGALIAGVDFVLMGAGIPIAIPGILKRLCNHETVELKIDVVDDTSEGHFSRFEPLDHWTPTHPLNKPIFVPIVSSAVLAASLIKRSQGDVDGFVIEHFSAGGHNAPPRGPKKLSDQGEPVYSERDLADIEQFKKLARPFWLAGSYGSNQKYRQALSLGATGIQVGSAFAYCNESGFSPGIKKKVYQSVLGQTASVFTDPLASPTGFPFKILSVEGSLSVEDVYENRKRICDLGYLRTPYLHEDGRIGYRCPSEKQADFVKKGGKLEDTIGRKCLCNGLTSAVDLAQVRDGMAAEAPLITMGDDFSSLFQFLSRKPFGYSAADVLETIVGQEATHEKIS